MLTVAVQIRKWSVIRPAPLYMRGRRPSRAPWDRARTCSLRKRITIAPFPFNPAPRLLAFTYLCIYLRNSEGANPPGGKPRKFIELLHTVIM